MSNSIRTKRIKKTNKGTLINEIRRNEISKRQHVFRILTLYHIKIEGEASLSKVLHSAFSLCSTVYISSASPFSPTYNKPQTFKCFYNDLQISDKARERKKNPQSSAVLVLLTTPDRSMTILTG